MTDDGWFGEAVAATYDDDPESTDPALLAATADVLASLAGDGPADASSPEAPDLA